MNGSYLLNVTTLLLALTPFAAAQPNPERANPSAENPLVALELPAEAVAYHLGLKSWAFTYNFYTDGDIYVGLSYYERSEDGTVKRTDFGQFTTRSDPSGQQYIAVILGPDGKRIPVSVHVNEARFLSEITENVVLGSFNSLAPTQPGITLPSTGQVGTFILMERYPENEDGGVFITGNPDDMDAYLTLEIGQASP